MTETQPFLPGMAPLDAGPTPLEQAARIQLQKLADDGLLNDNHAIAVQLVLDLARAIGVSATRGRASAMALASKELREALALLPAHDTDEFSTLMAQLTASSDPERTENATRDR